IALHDDLLRASGDGAAIHAPEPSHGSLRVFWIAKELNQPRAGTERRNIFEQEVPVPIHSEDVAVVSRVAVRVRIPGDDSPHGRTDSRPRIRARADDFRYGVVSIESLENEIVVVR